MENQNFSHILQKKGILKSFSVAKIVRKDEIKELETLIKTVASSEAEYKQLLNEELSKLSNMHDAKNPIPGIIYPDEISTRRELMFTISQKFADNIKKQKFTKKELAFLISAIISKFELTQEDFQKLNDEIDKELGEEEDGDN